MEQLLKDCIIEHLREEEGDKFNLEAAKLFVVSLKKPLKSIAAKLITKGVTLPNQQTDGTITA